MEAIKNRYEFVMFFDVENGNPNGDPDAGNMPRTDPETSFGIVTDVCIKRKIRNYVDTVKEGVEGYKILINPECSLNTKFTDAYKELGLETGNKKNKSDSDKAKAMEFICANYFDVRTFGAVMSTGDDPIGIVRGPVQINFARSIDEVSAQEITITRQARTTDERTETGDTEFVKKNIIPYGLYRADGYISAMLAKKTGFSDDDLNILWKAIVNMFEYDRSAARGKMVLRKLFIFKHSDALGNCPAHILLESVKAEMKPEKDCPRSFSDYIITVEENLPEGVKFIDGIELVKKL